MRREVTIAHNVPGTYNYTWNGNDNNGAALPNGIYPVNVIVAHPGVAPYTYPETSDTLTVSNVSASCDGDATPYVQVTVSFTLTDTSNSNPQNVHVKVYDPLLALIKDYTVPSPALGANSVSFPVNNADFQAKNGTWTFLVTATDTRSAADKGHKNKPALEKGTTFYAKLLNNPHYDQTPGNHNCTLYNPPQWTGYWCGEAVAKMWIDYRGATVSPTQQDISQYLVNTFLLGNGSMPDGLLDRGVWPCEMGATTGVSGANAVLNTYIGAVKYARCLAASQDTLIGQEVFHIAQHDEPSGAVAEMSYPNYQAWWHWMLVDGCVAASRPTDSMSTVVYGLFVDDPGGWFTAIPAYVSSTIWKQKYFWRQYTDRDGSTSFMDAEDPAPGGPAQIAPAICDPPTRPHGKPASEAQVNAIAHEGVRKHLLNLVGGFGARLQGSQQGKPVLVKALDGGDSYYVTPKLRGGVIVGAVIVEAETGEFHGVAVSDAGWKQYPRVSSEEAEFSVRSQTGEKVVSCELVWQFCNESLSRYDPLWKVTTKEGTVRYVSQDGKMHEALTRHSCVGR